MINYEGPIRVVAFVVMLVLMGFWEIVSPRRALTTSKSVRWLNNLALLATNTLVVRLTYATGAVGIALIAQNHRWGIFNFVSLPSWLEIVLTVLLFDLAIYLQHVLFHAVPLLWQMHRVHHADPDFDVTTGLRFHTLEIVLSLGIKATAIVLLGASPIGVLIFEIVLNVTSMFNHSNIRIPPWVDALLRFVVVTPDMHRVHHSVIPRETNSNYGFNLPWWDYLLGTYLSQPQEGLEKMRIGLTEVPTERAVWFHWLIALPFIRIKKEE